MSILIKSMEMPESCLVCRLSYVDRFIQLKCAITERDVRFKDEYRADDCPLIEIQPHGRLIDADALHEELYALEYARENEWLDGVREARGVDAARVALLDAPTIIPADKEKTCTKK